MKRRLSPYQRAENEAHGMRIRNQRNERCHLSDDHEPHVFRSMGRDNPCGGRGTAADKDADRRQWDRP